MNDNPLNGGIPVGEMFYVMASGTPISKIKSVTPTICRDKLPSSKSPFLLDKKN